MEISFVHLNIVFEFHFQALESRIRKQWSWLAQGPLLKTPPPVPPHLPRRPVEQDLKRTATRRGGRISSRDRRPPSLRRTARKPVGPTWRSALRMREDEARTTRRQRLQASDRFWSWTRRPWRPRTPRAGPSKCWKQPFENRTKTNRQ